MLFQDIRRSTRQRGAAALEMALILPSLLLITGTVATFGRALYAEYLLLNIANTAVRACVLQQPNINQSQPPPNVFGTVSSCISSTVTTVMGTYQNVCGSSGVTTNVTSATMPNTVAGSPYKVVYPIVSLSCNIKVLFVPGMPDVPIHATAAMPYIN